MTESLGHLGAGTNITATGSTTQSGLSEAQAAQQLNPDAGRAGRGSSRSYISIVRANLFTVFNLILAGFGTVTLIFGDWRDALFLGLIVANATIGISQEVRAKRTLDRLSLLVAPHARVRREGKTHTLASCELVIGDVVLISPGDQIVADGELQSGDELSLDESILSGESLPVPREPGEEVRSGAFAVEGSGSYVVSAVGAASYAARITGEARSFRHPRSPLERSVNRLLYVLVMLVLSLGALLSYSLYHRHVHIHEAVATASAGVVSLIPEGLVLLIGLTYAAAAIRMSRRGVLTQQLNGIESLAAVQTLCIDKTGTLTDADLRVVKTVPADGIDKQQLDSVLCAFAASTAAPNATVQAIGRAFPGQAQQTLAEIPFSSARRWSAVALAEGSYYLGAPERLPVETLAGQAQLHQRQGRRVLAMARGEGPLPTDPGDLPPGGLEPLGLVVLAESLRSGVRETIAFLLDEGVEIKVLSGDAPQTVAAIARDVGIPVGGINLGSDIPTDSSELHAFANQATVVGRITPQGKQAIVRALDEQGRYVAMVGDGVNDVPALKSSRLAIAPGSATQMARSVADLVLVSGDFSSVPALVAEGRRALRNLQRVTKLYVTKSAFAAFLILTIGTSSDAYPLLPRHLTLAAGLTIGIPTFFLALAPSSGPWQPDRFARRVARFAVPAGAVLGAGVVAGYLFGLHDLDLTVREARTVAVTTLVAGGLYLVLALEAEGSRQRSTLVGIMCALLGGLYVVVLLVPATRSFFALATTDPAVIATATIAGAITIGSLALAGFRIRATVADPTSSLA